MCQKNHRFYLFFAAKISGFRPAVFHKKKGSDKSKPFHGHMRLGLGLGASQGRSHVASLSFLTSTEQIYRFLLKAAPLLKKLERSDFIMSQILTLVRHEPDDKQTY